MIEEIISPLSGKILSIDVEVGKSIKEDTAVLVIEAMKMETVVYAPSEGIVKEIKIAVGDDVEEDDVLAILE